MRRQLIVLGIVVAVAALSSGYRSGPDPDYRVDGIRLGTSREEVESKLGPSDTLVQYWEDANYTAWAAKGWTAALGNHPEEATKSGQGWVRQEGYAYGSRENLGLPVVGYSGGEVTWVLGRVLRTPGGVLRGEQLVPRNHPVALGRPTERSGYCMDGPCAWTYQGGPVAVMSGSTLAGTGDYVVLVRIGR